MRFLVYCAIATTLFGSCSSSEQKTKGRKAWDSKIGVVDRQIAVIRGDAVRNPPTQEELVAAIAFLEEVSGVKAQITYSPMGPIAGLEDLLAAKRRWVGWRQEHDVILDENGHVRAPPPSSPPPTAPPSPPAPPER